MDFPQLKIGDLVAKIPVIQGGMGVGISLSGLASAVAKEGGIGVIAAAMIGMGEPDIGSNYREANVRALQRELRAAREKTDGMTGVTSHSSNRSAPAPVIEYTFRAGNVR